MRLTEFDPDSFLADYWQKKPLFIKNPWADWANPIEPDELAGLSIEDDIESRLVTGGDGQWQVENGPLAEDRFMSLSDKDWTLLVQAVDHHVPEVAALIDPFRFIPDWRIDDIMVSYAADGGGVGPHFDQYDVFLIQGLGKRRWQIGSRCNDQTRLQPHEELRLLAEFEAKEEWVCEPGDILYIPPGIAHNGVAIGKDCMTYSIGFRAPSQAELIGYWVDDLLADMPEDSRYEDPDLSRQANPGEINDSAIQRLHMMITETISDKEAFARWFGEYSSTPKYPDLDWGPVEPATPDIIRAKLASGIRLQRNPASRYSFIRDNGEKLLLFVDGESFECQGQNITFAETVCAHSEIQLDPAMAKSDTVVELICHLHNNGSLIIVGSDEAEN